MRDPFFAIIAWKGTLRRIRPVRYAHWLVINPGCDPACNERLSRAFILIHGAIIHWNRLDNRCARHLIS
jgi:hypothetical protein